MKILKIAILSLIFCTAAMTISGCDGNDNTAKEGKEYTSAYICPMHCDGSGSDEAGECPVCKMDYVKNEDHKADGHSH